MKKMVWLAGLFVILAASASSMKPQAASPPIARATGKAAGAAAQYPAPRTDTAYGRVPLQFIPNEGQLDSAVAFTIHGRDKTVHFSSEGLTFTLNGSREPAPAIAPDRATPNRPSSPSWVVKLDFLDANPDAVPVSLEESGAVISYFKGSRGDWKTGLRASSKIAYRELWPGIDLIYYGTVERMKYEFIVHPGADPSRIRLAYRGADSVTLTEEGRLEVMTPAAGFSDDSPAAWQEVDGRTVEIAMAYKLLDAPPSRNGVNSPSRNGSGGARLDAPESLLHAYGFEVGEYDRSRPLVLDPAVLVYCGFIGGSDTDAGKSIAVDESGDAYITGFTFSTEATFPVVTGPGPAHAGDSDAFVAKIDASGASLLYCGFLGGEGTDFGNGIAVDHEGNAYVIGDTHSLGASFPVMVGPDITPNEGGDAFVAKIDASGTSLVYCGYIGGSAPDYGYGIALDSAGNAYVTGLTYSTEATFPVLAGPGLAFNGGIADAFVAKVDASGASLVYCGYIGGAGFDSGNGIAVDGSGNAHVTGFTQSSEDTFPVTVGPGLTYNGEGDAFAAKVDASGTSLAYCGYIGGSAHDQGYGIAVDGSGNAYVTGFAGSSQATFPVIVGPSLIHGGYEDAFMAKVSADGAALVYCGYIGGNGNDRGTGIAVDGSGNAYVTGITDSTQGTFPAVAGPSLTHGGWRDAFVAKIDASGAALVYCGFIGGAGDDYGYGIAADVEGNAYVTGETGPTGDGFPALAGPYLTYGGGLSDAFVAKVSYADLPTLTSLQPAGAKAGDPAFVLTATGSDFVDGTVVLWDGHGRPTTFVNSFQLSAEIGAADLATGKIVEVTVANPPPVGGASEAVAFPVTTFTLGSSPPSATVRAGQSAAYTIQVTPQFGSFDSSIAFSCKGLPSATAASFSPASVIPGGGAAMTALTLTTRARQNLDAGVAIGSMGGGPSVLGPPRFLSLGLLLLFTALLLWFRFGLAAPAILAGRRLAAYTVICLVMLLSACSAGGGGPMPSAGTPAGTYQVTVQGASGGQTVSTTVTLIVN